MAGTAHSLKFSALNEIEKEFIEIKTSKYLLNHEGQDMRGNISMCLIFIRSVLVEELVQDLDNWQWGLVVLAQGCVVVHTLSVILEDTIKMDQAEEKQSFITPHVLDDVEETVEDVFCNFFFLP